LTRDRILVIDDDRDLCATVELRFGAAGFEVLEAGTGEEGIAVARSKRPLAIILDINMPGIDGFETCRRLRADPKTSAIPVIMLTTCTRVGELEEGLKSGADTYLTKPFDGPELVKEVREIVAARRGRGRGAKPPPSPRAQAMTRLQEALSRAPRRLGEVARAAPGVLLARPDDRLLAETALSDQHRPILFEEDVEPFAVRVPRKYLKLSPAVARAMAPDPEIFDAPKRSSCGARRRRWWRPWTRAGGSPTRRSSAWPLGGPGAGRVPAGGPGQPAGAVRLREGHPPRARRGAALGRRGGDRAPAPAGRRRDYRT